jgi:hypothetical protein
MKSEIRNGIGPIEAMAILESQSSAGLGPAVSPTSGRLGRGTKTVLRVADAAQVADLRHGKSGGLRYEYALDSGRFNAKAPE